MEVARDAGAGFPAQVGAEVEPVRVADVPSASARCSPANIAAPSSGVQPVSSASWRIGATIRCPDV